MSGKEADRDAGVSRRTRGRRAARRAGRPQRRRGGQGERVGARTRGGRGCRRGGRRGTEHADAHGARHGVLPQRLLKIFEDYILNHLKYFKDAELDESGDAEHRLDWWEIFQDYLKVFEGVMEFIEREGRFQRLLPRVPGEAGPDPHEKHFLKLLSPALTTRTFREL